MHYSSGNYIYKVGETKVKCLNCPSNENEHNDIDGDVKTEDVNVVNENDSIKTVSVKINGKEVIQTTTGKEKNGKLIINKDGIIVKTK